MSGHTPGPWLVECGRRATRLRVTRMSDGQPVAIIDSASANTDLAKADARLIAAAPELLDEVRSIAASCGGCNGNGTLGWDIKIKDKIVAEAGDDCDDCAEIRALIARATQP